MAQYDGYESNEQTVSMKSPDALYGEVRKVMAEGSQKEANGALEMFLAIYPNYALVHNDLGVLYFKEGEKDKALGHYEQAARLEPESVTFQKNLADFYYVEAGRVEEAMSLYVKVLDVKILQTLKSFLYQALSVCHWRSLLMPNSSMSGSWRLNRGMWMRRKGWMNWEKG